MRKILIGLFALGLTQHVMARPEIDKLAICYEVKNDAIKSKIPCIVTSGGGAGTSVIIYNFKGNEYTIVDDSDGSTLNGEPYKDYMRDSFFNKTESAIQKQYYCYQTKTVHFCAGQPN